MGLRDILSIDAPADSVVGELVAHITEALAERDDGTYDTDEMLFALASAVVGLEAELVNRSAETLELKAKLVGLERRILEAGIPLSAD